ncbi:MAG TPA: GDSL-type esterase/lipase family protein [Puia sp.]|nr:GDSL-type esterase/lipase family protein [Puia sp.]
MPARLILAAALLICLLRASAQTDTLSSVQECRPRNGLPYFFGKIRHHRPILVAYLGGSITEAAQGYRFQSLDWLRRHYPGVTFSELAAGVGGTGSDLGAFRLGTQVLPRRPDLVFVEFAVNDARMDTALIHSSMEGIVRQILRHNPRTGICFLYTMTADMYPMLSAGRLPPAARAMEDIAEHYGIPSIDLCLPIVVLADKGQLVWKGKPEDFPGKTVFSPDNVHPWPSTGHRLYTEAIARSLERMDAIGMGAPQALRVYPPPGTLPRPYTPDNWETAHMISADRLTHTGSWDTVSVGDAATGRFMPMPFPRLWRSGAPGAALNFSFTGTMAGLYDLMGPGSGSYEVTVDGRPTGTYIRFDSYCTDWRPQYFLVSGLSPGRHTLRFTVSASVPDKRRILLDKSADLDAHPDKYRSADGFAGWLLLDGKINR